MTHLQRLQIEQSEKREAVNALLAKGELDGEQRAALDSLTKRLQEIEPEMRAAIIATPDPVTEPVVDDGGREIRELRARASLGRYLLSAMRGRSVQGAERELLDECGLEDGAIPLELWDTNPPVEHRADVVSPAPGTVGINLDRLRPAVFAPSILPRLGVEMPRVASGTYASGTLTTSATAAAKAKSAVTDSAAAAFAVTTASPKRISTRLSIAIEDVAAVGQANFESVLRENISLVMSDALDDAGLNGDGSSDSLIGLFHRLDNPTGTPPSAVATFDDFAGVFADQIDGLWANTLMDVSIVAGPATYALSAKTFQSATNYKGEMSAAAYAGKVTGGWWTNKRMPAAATVMSVANIQQAIVFRKARSMMGGEGGMRTAVCPIWNQISIDDIYSGSAKGERYFTLHVLLGDVILVQPDAYEQVQFRVAT